MGRRLLLLSAKLLPIQIKFFDVSKESSEIVSKISKFWFVLWQKIEKVRKSLAYVTRAKFDRKTLQRRTARRRPGDYDGRKRRERRGGFNENGFPENRKRAHYRHHRRTRRGQIVAR
jgi:hypothetical protein